MIGKLIQTTSGDIGGGGRKKENVHFSQCERGSASNATKMF